MRRTEQSGAVRTKSHDSTWTLKVGSIWTLLYGWEFGPRRNLGRSAPIGRGMPRLCVHGAMMQVFI